MWGVSRIFGRFWGGVIGTPVFFCFNHSSRNASRPLCIRCASTAHPLRIQPFRGVKTTLLRPCGGGGNFGVINCLYIRLINLKRTLLHLAGTKNSSWTDRP